MWVASKSGTGVAGLSATEYDRGQEASLPRRRLRPHKAPPTVGGPVVGSEVQKVQADGTRARVLEATEGSIPWYAHLPLRHWPVTHDPEREVGAGRTGYIIYSLTSDPHTLPVNKS